MARWLLLGLLPGIALGAADAQFSYDAQLRAEQQLRFVFAQPPQPGPLLTTELFPTLVASAHLLDASLVLRYAPQLLIGDSPEQGPPELMNVGALVLERRFSKDRRVVLSEQVRYGTQDTLTLLSPGPGIGGAPTPAQTVPAVRSVRLGQSITDLLVDWRFTPTLKGTVAGSYLTGGGIGAGVADVPDQQTWTVVASLTDSVTRLDALTTRATALHSVFSTGQEAWVTQALEVWGTRLTREVALNLGAGASAVQGRSPAQAQGAWQEAPSGQLELRATLKARGSVTELGLLSQFGPYVDWVLGTVYQRGDAALFLQWASLPERLAVAARLQGAVGVGAAAQGQELLSWEVSATWGVAGPLALQLGSRVLWERMSTLGPHPYQEWLSYLSIVLTERGILSPPWRS